MRVVETEGDGWIRREDRDVPVWAGRSARPPSRAISMRMAALGLAFVGSFANPVVSQQDRAKERPSRRPAASIAERVRTEASKVDRAEVSPLFAAITGPTPDRDLRPRDEQVELCRKLESLARDIVRGWMLRGLDADPPPEASRLEARLADQGAQLREAVFAHAEAIALEGVLDPGQAKAWYKKSGTKPKPRLPSRSGAQEAAPPPETESAATLARSLRAKAGDLGRSGLIFDLMLGTIGIDQYYPEGFENLKPDKKRELMQGSDMPKAALAAEQAALARRLDGLTREIVAAWLVRGLDDNPPPSRDSLARRLQLFPPLADGLATRAEVIALEAILDPDQSDRVLAVLWLRMGSSALLDPALSSRLKLSRGQREEVRSLIDGKYKMLKKIGEASIPVTAQAPAHPELYELLHALGREGEARRGEADMMIWNVLSPAQMRTMARLLRPGTDRKPENDAKKPRPSG